MGCGLRSRAMMRFHLSIQPMLTYFARWVRRSVFFHRWRMKRCQTELTLSICPAAIRSGMPSRSRSIPIAPLQSGPMPGHAVMQTKPTTLAIQQLDSIDGTITSHTFHYSQMTTTLTPWLTARHPLSGAQGEPLFRHGAIIATYLHLYWPSNPIFTARLLRGHLSDRVGICTVSHPIAAANDFKGVESDAGQDAL